MATSRISALRTPLCGATRLAAETASRTPRQASRSLFTAPRVRDAPMRWAPNAGRRFTTGARNSSSFWSKGAMMTGGGLAFFGLKATMAERSSMGLAVVECEAAVAEPDVTKLMKRWFSIRFLRNLSGS